MEINLNKSTKRALSLVLAFAVLIGSLFTANIGVNINASAAVTATDTWDGTIADGFASGSGGEKDPYIIETPEQLAYLVSGAGGYEANANQTAGKYYKVADGQVFDMAGLSGITLDSNLTAVKAATVDTNKNWKKTVHYKYSSNSGTTDSDMGFQGNFDGNGLIVYSLYGQGDAIGLFPIYDGGAVIKNVTVKNSKLIDNGGSNRAAGGILGSHMQLIAESTSLAATIDGCTVENCEIASNNSKNTGGAGSIVGGARYRYVTVNNCASINNSVSATVDGCTTGVVGQANNTKYISVSNTIVVGSAVASHGLGTYTNVYTDQGVTITGVTALTTEQMTGDAAMENMPNLAWYSDWTTRENDYPIPYIPVYDFDYWDGTAATSFAGGTGTEDDPYIIETPEQLYKMVRDSGRQYEDNPANIEVGTAAYYKVADGVTDLYLNPVLGGGRKEIENLASGTAGTDYQNWSYEFDADKYYDEYYENLLESDTIFSAAEAEITRDEARQTYVPVEAAAFVGVFDGNGVTIRGLISTTNDAKYLANYNADPNNTATSWHLNTGVGFVPALKENAVIKNVTFDSSYIYDHKRSNAGVITSNFSVFTHVTNNYIGIYNVAVTNAHVETTQKSNTHIGGLIGTDYVPTQISFVNCVYDGTTSTLTDANTTDYKAGILSAKNTINDVSMSGCLSIDSPVISQPEDIAFTNYDLSTNTRMNFENCYTNVAFTSASTMLEGGITVISGDVNATTAPNLNWSVLEPNEDGIPIPTMVSSFTGFEFNYADVLSHYGEFCEEDAKWGIEQKKFMGFYNFREGPYDHYTFSEFSNLLGSGTKDDPYIITNAEELAQIISCGGMNTTHDLYFKLGCDIDLGGLRWIDNDGAAYTHTNYENYGYTAFGGHLDGDGHTITGLYAVDDDAAGLIPVLATGGSISNLHIRDSYVSSGSVTGSALVGSIESGAADTVISGCSVEATGTYNCANPLVSNGIETITNSYYIMADGTSNYYNANSEIVTANQITVDYDGTNADTAVWYKGGAEGSVPRLVNRAAAMTVADVEGNGNGYEYDGIDLVALRNKLLRKSAFQNIYGDVSKDGVVNSSDLVILRRAMVTDYQDTQDGFWRNVELGKVQIYYAENDTQDMARKLELYLESAVPGSDIIKYAGSDVTDDSVENKYTTDPVDNAVIITAATPSTTDTDTAYADYSVEYDKETNILKFNGGSFTAVEQAVLEFITESDYATGDVYETDGTKSLLTLADKNNNTGYKSRVKVGDNYYYYAWGDEFDNTEADGTSVNYDNWFSDRQQSESMNGDSSAYKNQEVATPKALDELLVVSGGKLSMKRGFRSGTNSVTDNTDNGFVALDVTDGESNGYTTIESNDNYFSSGQLTTERSMMFKQGYIEIEASVPADGHAFPAWWLMGSTSGSFRNDGWDRSLFSKIYKFNEKWDGTNQINQSNLNTYKYQVPSAYYEIDMFEVMQLPVHVNQIVDDGGYYDDSTDYQTHKTAVGWYAMNGTIHKWYDNGTYKSDTPGDVTDDILYIANWDDYNVSKEGISHATFAGSSSDWSHRFKETTHDFGTTQTKYTSWGSAKYYTPCTPNEAGRNSLQTTRRYGFLWTATDETFECTLYIYDANGDGDESDVVTLSITHEDDVTTGEWEDGKWPWQDGEMQTEDTSTYGDSAYNSKLMNSYMYLLLDNKFYTYNNKGTGVEYTDMLTAEGNTSFDINYVRVYQLDGRRDIVTPETEAFNNNNHFGY